jgi:hydrophobe/amphiphile efflux-1 (HAE1) family protein
MNISALFIRRPIATSLLAAAILFAGASAYTQLPVAPLPNVDFPTLTVTAMLPGASPETMASAVATPLERRFGRIAGLAEMTSSNTLGQTNITLQFGLDRDFDSAARDVQAAINAAGGELPANLPSRPIYRKTNPADSPIMILAATSNAIPLPVVFDQVNTVLVQKISQISGVGQVTLGGAQQPAVRIRVDPQALAAAGLTLEDVRVAVGAQTADRPKGALHTGDRAAVVAANDQLFGPPGWRDVALRSAAGSVLRLGDIARVEESFENERVAGWSNTERAVIVIVRRQPGANIIGVSTRIKQLLPELIQSISPAIDVGIASERTQTIRASVFDVEVALAISVCLVVLVVFAFLRTARATVIPTVAVPVSLVGTFGVMYLAGYSIDNLSLMALTISTGFVVDDAIVVAENVTRLVEQGVPAKQAALRGASQIGFTIISMTASLLAVFVPILFMEGAVGRLFREFAVTLSIAIGLSAVISLTLTASMCALLLRVEPRGARPGLVSRILERGFSWLQLGYEHALRVVLRHRFGVGLLTIVTVMLTVTLYAIVPKGLFPQQDTGLAIGVVDAPQDISFPAMRERVTSLNRVLSADPDVQNVVSFIGSGLANTSNSGSMFITLKPKPARKVTTDEVIRRLRKKLEGVTGVELFLQARQDVSMGGRLSRTQYQYTLQDANLDQLREWGPKILAKLRTLPELRDVASDQQTGGLGLDVEVDRDSAARLGVTMKEVDDALYDAMGQRQVATVYTQLNQYRIVLEMDPELARDPRSLERIYVRSATGDPVPLASVSKLSTSRATLSVNHQGQFPSVTLSFNTAPGVALGEAIDAIHRAETTLGVPASIHASFQGTAQAFRESLASEPWLILAALITVYIVLGMLYESFIHPITILSTLPSAGVGALLALLATRRELSIVALIGIILLIGIVKKNAILMIDFAISAQRGGSSAEDAIFEACTLRFRPILMTTMAAILGAVPLAIGGGAGSELRQPLGITIIGGLAFSQLLTLFTTPVTYLALDRFVGRRRVAAQAAEARP